METIRTAFARRWAISTPLLSVAIYYERTLQSGGPGVCRVGAISLQPERGSFWSVVYRPGIIWLRFLWVVNSDMQVYAVWALSSGPCRGVLFYFNDDVGSYNLKNLHVLCVPLAIRITNETHGIVAMTPHIL